MVLDLTTLARVKLHGSIADSTDDTLIQNFITSVSDDAEKYLGRHVQVKTRTETYRLTAHQHIIRLQGYPVEAVTEVKYDSRADSWANVTAMDSSLYTLDADTGTIFIRPAVPHSPGYARVTYRGGLVGASGDNAATTTTNFIAAHPAIAMAVDSQVIEELRRRKNPTGSIMFKGSMVQQSTEAGLLKDVRRRLNSLKRRRVR